MICSKHISSGAVHGLLTREPEWSPAPQGLSNSTAHPKNEGLTRLVRTRLEHHPVLARW